MPLCDLPPGDRFAMVRDLAGGNFIAQQRNVVLVGGTGTGKTHLAMAIARSCIRAGSRGRFFNTVEVQGFLFSEPVPASEVMAMLGRDVPWAADDESLVERAAT
jgi:KaiC/GvpD/RAD55 family RecA-like ATPase